MHIVWTPLLLVVPSDQNQVDHSEHVQGGVGLQWSLLSPYPWGIRVGSGIRQWEHQACLKCAWREAQLAWISKETKGKSYSEAPPFAIENSEIGAIYWIAGYTRRLNQGILSTKKIHMQPSQRIRYVHYESSVYSTAQAMWLENNEERNQRTRGISDSRRRTKIFCYTKDWRFVAFPN